ncbi:MAG: FmdB family zinc ribbon protein [Thermodesulfobacteriota bacterium]
MPIYEYNCRDCKKTVSILFLSISEAEAEETVCPECGEKNLERIVSGVSVIKGQNEPKKTNSKKTPKNDPDSLAKTMRKENSKSRQDYGDDFKEVAHRLEKGENPDSIEKSLRKRVGEDMGTH